MHQGLPVCSPMQAGQAPKWVLHARQDLVVGKATITSLHAQAFVLASTGDVETSTEE